MKAIWPFGVVVRVRDPHGFVVQRRIWRRDLPVLNDGLVVDETMPQGAANEARELKEQLGATVRQLGAARAKIALQAEALEAWEGGWAKPPAAPAIEGAPPENGG